MRDPWNSRARSRVAGLVGHLQIIRTAALASACLAALSLAACNNGGPAQGATQNGAYVATNATNAVEPASDQSQAAGNQSLPPSSEYQAVAQSAPPALPAYDQPPIPGPGYLWTPGYWAYGRRRRRLLLGARHLGGAPVSLACFGRPAIGAIVGGAYAFNAGYWGPHIGFYGGIDYGYGYGGNGYAGGRWQGDQFYYNSQANNLGAARIAATYSQAVAESAVRVSFNGGPGGLRVAPMQADFAAAQTRRVAPTSDQRDQARMASAQPQLRASVNRGAPPIAATARPKAFQAGAIAARSAGGVYTPPVRPGPATGLAPGAPSACGRTRRDAGANSAGHGRRAGGARPGGAERVRTTRGAGPRAGDARAGSVGSRGAEASAASQSRANQADPARGQAKTRRGPRPQRLSPRGHIAVTTWREAGRDNSTSRDADAPARLQLRAHDPGRAGPGAAGARHQPPAVPRQRRDRAGLRLLRRRPVRCRTRRCR